VAPPVFLEFDNLHLERDVPDVPSRTASALAGAAFDVEAEALIISFAPDVACSNPDFVTGLLSQT